MKRRKFCILKVEQMKRYFFYKMVPFQKKPALHLDILGICVKRKRPKIMKIYLFIV